METADLQCVRARACVCASPGVCVSQGGGSGGVCVGSCMGDLYGACLLFSTAPSQVVTAQC